MRRRDFIKTAGVGLAGAAFAGGSLPAHRADAAARHGTLRLRKALKFSMVEEDLSVMEKFALLKQLGFDGVELSSPNDLDREEVVRARDETGLPIHGVVDSVHWEKTLADPDPAVRAEGLAGLRTALSDADAYGATTVLLVPAVVSRDVSYADAYRRSQAEIRKVLPLAEELGVKIALENVWNNFLLSPLEAARYVDAFESPQIGWYFDVGNVVRYGWPQHWIEALGERILKLDIKAYSRDRQNEAGPGAGFGVEIGEGSIDWPAVREALAQVGYDGWATAEVPGGDRARLAEIARRMDEHVLAAGS